MAPCKCLGQMARKNRGIRHGCASRPLHCLGMARMMEAALPPVGSAVGADGAAVSKAPLKTSFNPQTLATTKAENHSFKDCVKLTATAIPDNSTNAATCSPVSAPSPEARRLRIEEPMPCPALSEPGLPTPRPAAAAAEAPCAGIRSCIPVGKGQAPPGFFQRNEEGNAALLPARCRPAPRVATPAAPPAEGNSTSSTVAEPASYHVRLPTSKDVGEALGFVSSSSITSSSSSSSAATAAASAAPYGPYSPRSSSSSSCSGRSTSFESTCETALVDAKYDPSCMQPTAAEQKRRQESRLCEDALAQAIRKCTKTKACRTPGLALMSVHKELVQDMPKRKTYQADCFGSGAVVAEKVWGAYPVEAAGLLQHDRVAAVSAAVHALEHTRANVLVRELKGCELVRSAVAANGLQLTRLTCVTNYDVREVPRPADEEEVAGCRWFEVVLVSKWAERGSVADRLDEIKRRAWRTGQVDWKEVMQIHIQCCRILKMFEDAGVLCPDWKLENLVMDAKGYISCIDFDDAMLLRAPPPGFSVVQDRRLLGRAFLMHTPCYAAPEMLTGAQEVCLASHIYIFGMCLRYHMGELELALREYAEYSAGAEEPQVPKQDMAVLDGLLAVMQRCVQESPADRPAPGDVAGMLMSVMQLLPQQPAQAGQSE